MGLVANEEREEPEDKWWKLPPLQGPPPDERLLTAKPSQAMRGPAIDLSLKSELHEYENTALLKIEGAKNKDDGKFYVGKRAVYVYKCKNPTPCPTGGKSRLRSIWGKVTRVH